MPDDTRWRYPRRGEKHPDDLVCAACGQPLSAIRSDPDHLLHHRPDLNTCPTRVSWFDATTRKNYVRCGAVRRSQESAEALAHRLTVEGEPHEAFHCGPCDRWHVRR